MKSRILAPVLIAVPEGERSPSFIYNDRGYNISYPWSTLPYPYRHELMYGVTDELLRHARRLDEKDSGKIRPRCLP